MPSGWRGPCSFGLVHPFIWNHLLIKKHSLFKTSSTMRLAWNQNNKMCIYVLSESLSLNNSIKPLNHCKKEHHVFCLERPCACHSVIRKAVKIISLWFSFPIRKDFMTNLYKKQTHSNLFPPAPRKTDLCSFSSGSCEYLSVHIWMVHCQPLQLQTLYKAMRCISTFAVHQKQLISVSEST